MFERFTDRARLVVVLAQEEARMLNHGFIGTEHLLLGLIREEDGVAAQALASLGVGLEAVRQRVEEAVGRGKQESSGHIPFTPRVKKVLELSLREALQRGQDFIGPEHILLGLIREGEGVACQVLVELGADQLRVRSQVTGLLDDGGGDKRATARQTRLPGWAGRRERAAPSGFRGRLEAIEARLSAIEQRIGEGPQESDIDQQIAKVRADRQAAAQTQDYENAAALRDKERELAAQRTARQEEWSASQPSLPALAETVRALGDEIEHLRDLLSRHGIGPDQGAA